MSSFLDKSFRFIVVLVDKSIRTTYPNHNSNNTSTLAVGHGYRLEKPAKPVKGVRLTDGGGNRDENCERRLKRTIRSGFFEFDPVIRFPANETGGEASHLRRVEGIE